MAYTSLLNWPDFVSGPFFVRLCGAVTWGSGFARTRFCAG